MHGEIILDSVDKDRTKIIAPMDCVWRQLRKPP